MRRFEMAAILTGWLLADTSCARNHVATMGADRPPPDIAAQPLHATAEPVVSSTPTEAPLACVPGARVDVVVPSDRENIFAGCGHVLADVTEVTVGQYAACVSSGSCAPIDDADECRRGTDNPRIQDFPQGCVSRHMASSYCEWSRGRLPTALEWTFLATGGHPRLFPWGDDAPTPERTSLGVFDSMTVCSFLDGASPLGLYGMSGNVWEWVEDRRGTDVGIQCGGSFASRDVSLLTARCESAERVESRSPHVGFRCVYCEPELQAEFDVNTIWRQRGERTDLDGRNPTEGPTD